VISRAAVDAVADEQGTAVAALLPQYTIPAGEHHEVVARFSVLPGG
jgi:hypothetical protein